MEIIPTAIQQLKLSSIGLRSREYEGRQIRRQPCFEYQQGVSVVENGEGIPEATCRAIIDDHNTNRMRKTIHVQQLIQSIENR